MSNQATAIIGGGWLGKALACQLKQDSHSVFVSRTSDKGVELLTQEGLQSILVKLPFSAGEQSSFIRFLQDNNISTLVGSFPPGFRKGSGQEYLYQWRSLIEAVSGSDVKKIIMISSTTVYPAGSEVMNEDVASYAKAMNDERFSDNARIMLQAEQALIDSGVPFVIIRCAGLYGPERHPGRFVAKIPAISSTAPANMLHLEDAVNIVRFADQQLCNEVINACSPDKVSKEQFYRQALNDYDSSLPFPPVTDKADKNISSQKLLNTGYRFTFENPLQGLKHC
ncbi:NAD(P)H-binding protein [Vibrio sp. SCSIO 43137]|uniref:NAD(P)H-binding protein n=1 Tax=Vibrio sp. SCSIO 43137 TaxID=3021011 RepID=UPI002306FAF6|nr:NAD-dependent epimerase/dehydratase family protein [Vibrio sp. SCSIO 43137]WCE28549.1 NAD-dependent epimerase/dehydratase family protein [Vibrio sp. SCSIO 43137]